ncbi:hypothetical protein [Maridesulfovibrio zosterae]|nr:hypothetical protein [Maridesulfovibrio zosterae]
MAMKITAEYLNVYSVMTYPGSELCDQAIENNWTLPEKWQGSVL